jgi:membrane-associated phospholipid phosphatase
MCAVPAPHRCVTGGTPLDPEGLARAPRARAIARALWCAAAALGVLAARPAAAQEWRSDLGRLVWPGAALVAGAALLDEPARDHALGHRGRTLDGVADVGNVLGTGRYLIAGMAVTYGAARLTRQPEWSRSVLHVAAAYVAGNAVVSALKPAVGRQRPYVTGHPDRFRPFRESGDWHAFPSAHAIHAFSLAAAVAEEAHRPWVSVLGYGAASVVAWSRVYVDQHWLSDVAGSGVLGIVAAKATVRWLHQRERRRGGQQPPRVTIVPVRGGVALSVGTR